MHGVFVVDVLRRPSDAKDNMEVVATSLLHVYLRQIDTLHQIANKNGWSELKDSHTFNVGALKAKLWCLEKPKEKKKASFMSVRDVGSHLSVYLGFKSETQGMMYQLSLVDCKNNDHLLRIYPSRSDEVRKSLAFGTAAEFEDVFKHHRVFGKIPPPRYRVVILCTTDKTTLHSSSPPADPDGDVDMKEVERVPRRAVENRAPQLLKLLEANTVSLAPLQLQAGAARLLHALLTDNEVVVSNAKFDDLLAVAMLAATTECGDLFKTVWTRLKAVATTPEQWCQLLAAGLPASAEDLFTTIENNWSAVQDSECWNQLARPIVNQFAQWLVTRKRGPETRPEDLSCPKRSRTS
jgi:hypothetical protein